MLHGPSVRLVTYHRAGGPKPHMLAVYEYLQRPEMYYDRHMHKAITSLPLCLMLALHEADFPHAHEREPRLDVVQSVGQQAHITTSTETVVGGFV